MIIVLLHAYMPNAFTLLGSRRLTVSHVRVLYNALCEHLAAPADKTPALFDAYGSS